jgi:uncharacterized phage protein (TIGR02220 family)
MAVGKKKIIVYTDWITQFKDLTDEEAGKLIKHFFEYVNDLNPKSDRLIELLFNPIKATLKRDLKSWESKQQTNKENGLKGGRPRKEKTQKNPNNPVGLIETQNNPQKGVSDSVSVSVNDNDKKDISVINFDKLLDYINLSFDRQFRTINNKVKQSFKARLKEGYTNEDIKNCIENIKNNKYHIENGYQYCTPEYISRPVTLDKFSKVNSKVAKETSTLDDYASNVMKQVEALKNMNK